MSEFRNAVYKHLSAFTTNPYLFVGSGLSRRYYNLPTWVQLLKDFYPVLNNGVDFNYYLSKCNNDPVALASVLSEEFHEVWWKSPTFSKSRTAFGEQATGSMQLPFKYELSQFVKKQAKSNAKLKTEIDLLSNCVVDGIITTNWDNFLQTLFPDFIVYIGQQELLFADSLSVGDIYKIHGCATRPETIIVTDADYKDFNSKNAYLAAKLLTIFVEHPIIFLGYSISDGNVIEIIDSIVQCLDSKNIGKLKDRLIFVEWDSSIYDPIFQDGNIVLKDQKVLPIKHIKLSSFDPLYEIMGSLKKRLPIKVLRKLKDSVYEIIKTNQPTKNIYVGELNDLDEDNQVEFVVGVGVAKNALSAQGYVGISTLDILEDIIFDNKGYNAQLLVEKAFPKLAKGNAFVPMCKYFKELGYYSKNNVLNSNGQAAIKAGNFTYRDNMPDCLMPPKSYNNKKAPIRSTYKDIGSILSAFDSEHAIIYIPFLERKYIDLKSLQQFLAQIFKNEKQLINSAFRKLVCLYDFYKNC